MFVSEARKTGISMHFQEELNLEVGNEQYKKINKNYFDRNKLQHKKCLKVINNIWRHKLAKM